MHVGSSNPRYTYEIDGSEIQVIHEEKDLGVTIVDNLKTSVQLCSSVRQGKSYAWSSTENIQNTQ